MPVGVVVPVSGFAPFLPEALDAVLAQGPDRVVVVDDGSDPRLHLHPDHRARVTLVRREAAGGPALARQAGLEALDGACELVALCDADDAWRPGHLAAHLEALAAAPGVAFSFGAVEVVGLDGRPAAEQWPAPAPGRRVAATWGPALFVDNPVPTSSVVLRVEALDEVGGFPGPVRVAEDWELWLRLVGAGHDALCVAGSRVAYRRHPGGLTADVARLARAQLALHAVHAGLVDPETARAVEASDLAALADGLVRDGDERGARAAYAQLAQRRGLTARERAKRAALGVPGGARLLARGDSPYA